MAARADDLLPVEYFHVVFTLPAEIARIAYWNKKAVYGLLFKASAETVTTIAADPKRLDAKVGMTCVLHTSCQRRVYDTTPNRPSADQKPCSPISADIRTVWRSQTAV